MKILILEDEKLAQEKMTTFIKSFDKGFDIVKILDGVVQGVKFLDTKPELDLIFADVELSDGNSFEIFEKIPPPCPIIFVTAYDKYALKAFKINSIDYLLKPVQKEDLMAAIMKYYKSKSHESLMSKANVTMDGLRQTGSIFQGRYKSRFMTRIGETYTFTPVEEIAYFSLEPAGTYLYTWDNNKQFVDHNLEQLESMLPPSLFFRINRAFIAHINAIDKLIRYSNRRLKVVVKNFEGEDLVISREKSQRLKEWLDS